MPAMNRHQKLFTRLLAPSLLLAAACGAEARDAPTALPDPTAATAATVTSTVTSMAATPTPPATASTPASSAASPLPEKLTSAPALIYRALDTGAINARSTLTTRTLQRFEDQALLTVLEQTVNNSSEMTPTHLKPFGAPTIRRFVGSVTTKGKRTTFYLADAGEKVTLECEMGNVNAAAATAVRASSRKGGCNGDRGHWVPSTMKRVEALRCGIEREAASIDSPDRREEMAFAASPGIEFLFVNDDCVMQGGGYRFVPPDSAVGPIRPPGG